MRPYGSQEYLKKRRWRAIELLKQGLFDRDHVARQFRAHRQGKKDEAVRLWTLFNLAAWHAYWIEGTASR